MSFEGSFYWFVYPNRGRIFLRENSNGLTVRHRLLKTRPKAFQRINVKPVRDNLLFSQKTDTDLKILWSIDLAQVLHDNPSLLIHGILIPQSCVSHNCIYFLIELRIMLIQPSFRQGFHVLRWVYFQPTHSCSEPMEELRIFALKLSTNQFLWHSYQVPTQLSNCDANELVVLQTSFVPR